MKTRVIGITETSANVWRVTFNGSVLGDSRGHRRAEALAEAMTFVERDGGLDGDWGPNGWEEFRNVLDPVLVEAPAEEVAQAPAAKSKGKTTYIAFDANGAAHTRSTAREYTHTVVGLPSLEKAMTDALSPWGVDASNYEYFRKIAMTNGDYLAQACYRTADKWTAEQIAEEKASKDAANAKRLAEARDLLDRCPTLAAYRAQKQVERVAAVEKSKAEGAYEKWVNIGFCGRLDLAQKLAAKPVGYYAKTAVLECRPATPAEIKANKGR